MKQLIVLLNIIILIIFISSCETKEADMLLESRNQSECFGFDQSELQSVGILHNQYLSEVYQNIDFARSNDCRNDIIQEFMNLDVDFTSLNKTKADVVNEAVTIYDSIKLFQFDVRNWSSHPFSAESYSYLSTIMVKIDELQDYSSFVSEMTNLQNIVNNDNSLDCFTKELLNGTIEVAKNSLYLWTPEELGGLGYWDISHPRISSRWSWRGAAKGDAITSAVYFNSMGAGLAIGLITPGSNAAILGMWAIGTAIGSALGGAAG